MIGVVESKATLAPHVGHKVDITGTAVPDAEAEAMKPAPPKADHYMRITAREDGLGHVPVNSRQSRVDS